MSNISTPGSSDTSDEGARAGHVVLCGLGPLGLRTLEELRRLGEEVVVVARAAEEAFAAEARALGATLLQGNPRDESALRAAGVPRACAIVLTDDDDIANLHAALTAQELNPHLRVVLRMFNQELGRRLEGLFRNGAVLSSSAIAAPPFVDAALHDDWDQRITVAGRTLVVRPGAAGQPDVLMPVARFRDNGAVELFPRDGADLLCLVDEGPASRLDAAVRRRFRPAGAVAGLWRLAATSDRRIKALVAILVGLTLASTLVFYALARMPLLDAVFFTLSVIATGFGDTNLRDTPTAVKLYGVVLMLLGAAALAIFYAMITDALIGARLTRVLGGLPRRLRDHVVVCGVGNIGYRVVEQIARLGVPVAAAEVDATNRFLPAVRRLGVPTLVADACLPETLRALNVADARCLVAATNDDLANLETALNARALNPRLRVVLRLFDPDLAARVERAFDIHISRSPSALAAPAFAAAAVGRRVVATLPAGRRVLVLAQFAVEPGSAAAGRTVADLEARAEGRVLLITQAGRQTWRPTPDAILAPGQELLVVASRSGVAQVATLTEAQTGTPAAAGDEAS